MAIGPGGQPRAPGGQPSRRAVILGVCGTVLVIGVVLTLRIHAPSPVSQEYRRLSDATLQRCDPRIQADFSACVDRFQRGAAGIQLPDEAKRFLQNIQSSADTARSCVAQQDEDNSAIVNWPAECPQKGPTDTGSGVSEDASLRSRMYQQMLTDDSRIRAVLDLPNPSPAA